MRKHGKPEDVAFFFGHSVEVANSAYDKGRAEATAKAAMGYFADLAAAMEREKKTVEDVRDHSN
jgi:hypothetical protein